MQLLRKLFGKQRGRERLTIELPVLVDGAGEGENRFMSADLSETGLRMDITEVASPGDLTRGSRSVGLSIVLAEDQDPVKVRGELIWTKRDEDGKQFSGWMFCDYPDDSRDRLAEFIRERI
ncbi:MAG: PilZ domain-containing protein [Candidatus Latescibacteria bacterium]|jgi:hypothetical protein|nr:PilZ domain-containing protein [Candidatus Latescibacterota bacterium]